MDQGSGPAPIRTEPPQCLFQELSVKTTEAPGRKLSTPEPLKGAKQVPGGNDFFLLILWKKLISDS